MWVGVRTMLQTLLDIIIHLDIRWYLYALKEKNLVR